MSIYINGIAKPQEKKKKNARLFGVVLHMYKHSSVVGMFKLQKTKKKDREAYKYTYPN